MNVRATHGRRFGSNPYVIAVDARFARERRILDIDPVLDLLVPGVGRVAQQTRKRLDVAGLGDLRRGEQRRNGDSKREGRIAGILLPTVLLGSGPGAQDEARRALDHRPELWEVRGPERALASGHIQEQHGERAFIELHAAPIGRAVQPIVLPPRSVSLLGRPKITKDSADLAVRAAREQRASGFAKIAGPDQMVAPHVVVALAEAPRNRQAGDEASWERRRLMDAKDVGAHAIDVLAMSMPLHRAQGRLPSAPSGRIVIQNCLERAHARSPRVIGGLRRGAAKSDRQNRSAVGSHSELS